MSDKEVRLEWPKVLSAAVLVPGERGDLIVSLPRPARHHDVVHALHDVGIPQGEFHVQGFLLSDGTFSTRVAALVVAQFGGQILPGQGKHNKLFSEDVW